MSYKLLVKCWGKWQVVGFSHATLESARGAAMLEWPGLPFLVLPEV